MPEPAEAGLKTFDTTPGPEYEPPEGEPPERVNEFVFTQTGENELKVTDGGGLTDTEKDFVAAAFRRVATKRIFIRLRISLKIDYEKNNLFLDYNHLHNNVNRINIIIKNN